MTVTTMTVAELFSKELEQEAQATRKMLERVPADKYDWQPPQEKYAHDPAGNTRSRTACLDQNVTINRELGLAKNENPLQGSFIIEELVAYFEKSQAEGKAALAEAQVAQLEQPWTLREGDQIYSISTKAEVGWKTTTTTARTRR